MAYISFDQNYSADPKYVTITFSAPDFFYKITEVQIMNIGPQHFSGSSRRGEMLEARRQISDSGEISLAIVVCDLEPRLVLSKIIRDQNMAGEGFDTVLRLLTEKLEKLKNKKLKLHP